MNWLQTEMNNVEEKQSRISSPNNEKFFVKKTKSKDKMAAEAGSSKKVKKVWNHEANILWRACKILWQAVSAGVIFV